SRDCPDRIRAGRIPKPGRTTLNPMLAPAGRISEECSSTCPDDEKFNLTASYGAQGYHMRWFAAHEEDGVLVENISDAMTGFQIAGPKARELLARVTREDVSHAAFKFLDAKRMVVGLCEALVQRVSYSGDLGYEIYVDITEQRALWNALWQAGADLGLRPFGMRAMMSLRLDRFFGAWLREFGPDYTCAETGLDRFLQLEKDADFIGKDAALKDTPTRRLCAFEVDAADADVTAYEPIWLGGEVVGFCTSGGYSHYAEKSIALGFVPVNEAHEGLEVEIEILGEMRPARLITRQLFDPEMTRMRS
ncbi:MAG: aminomethyl transferase family protein, partial [Rhodobacteraceae bacterium]|nr:aminomethyl transferase family protein [Paracoccaceae bacterium]